MLLSRLTNPAKPESFKCRGAESDRDLMRRRLLELIYVIHLRSQMKVLEFGPEEFINAYHTHGVFENTFKRLKSDTLSHLKTMCLKSQSF